MALQEHPSLSRLQTELAQDHAEAEFQSSLISLLDRLEQLNALAQDRAV